MPLDVRFMNHFGTVAKTVTAFEQAKVLAARKNTAGQSVGGAWIREAKTERGLWSLPESLRSRVSGGFCFGACLDWLRKVLLRDDDGRHAISHEKSSRVMRMAQVHRDQKTALEGHGAKVGRDRDEGKRQAQLAFRRWLLDNRVAHNVDSRGYVTNYTTNINNRGEDISSLIANRVEQFNSELAAAERLVTDWNALNKGERFQESWGDLVGATQAHDAGKKRRLCQILPVCCSSQDRYLNYSDFLSDAIGQHELLIGRGIILSMDLQPPPGHAVAVHRAKEDAYFLFDPNLGVYRCDSRTDLLYALLILAEEGYVDADTRLGDEHSWRLFAKTEGFVPRRESTVTKLEKCNVLFQMATASFRRIGYDHASPRT